MKSTPAVVKALQKVLANELAAINQYFMHAKMFGHWGYVSLAKKSRAESIDEMHHADELMERLLLLDTTPEMKSPEVKIGKNVPDMLKCDLKLEHEAIKDLAAGVKTCERDGDYISRQLLADILKSEEAHIEWLETQLALIDQMGLPNYLQLAAAGTEAGE